MTRRLRSGRDEEGVVAIVVALVALILMGSAALAIDIALQSNERQKLHDTLDAAAHAGAYELPDGDASGAALGFAAANDPETSPDLEFYCVVSSVEPGSSENYKVDEEDIPGSCYPGPKPYIDNINHYPGLRCNESICAIPCDPSQEGVTCNTVKVTDEKTVDYSFGPAIGIDEGSTGSISSAACKGPCGNLAPNPMDIVVVGDRTPSMETEELVCRRWFIGFCIDWREQRVNHVEGLVSGIKGLLEMLNPEQHRVALGTIGRSSETAPANCLSAPSTGPNYISRGPFVPVPFSDDYLVQNSGGIGDPGVLNGSSSLVKAVECLDDSYSPSGTYLSAPMMASRQLLTGGTARADVGKAIVFMTDGEPWEKHGSPGGGYPYDANGQTACNNMVEQARQAKAAGITVLTIGYRLQDVRCTRNNTSTSLVTTKLAAMAGTGDQSATDETGCRTAADMAAENADGDLFFCAASPEDLEPVFRTAAGSLQGGTKLIKLP